MLKVCGSTDRLSTVSTAGTAVAITSLKSPRYTIIKVLRREYSEVTVEKFYKGRNLFL
jgi:hypothetical protein